MFCHTALPSPRTNRRDHSFIHLPIGAICSGRQLDKCVQRDVQPGRFLLVFFHEVGIDAAEDGLVRYDEDILAALELHDDGFKTDYDVAVASGGMGISGGCQGAV